MKYKNKVFILLAMIFALGSIYILAVIFDPARRQQSRTFAWLDPHLLDRIDRIELYGRETGIILDRRNNVWVFSGTTMDFPIKQERVQELLTLLTQRQRYTLRATSEAARESLGVTGEIASRIIIRGGPGLPLLDLLIGWPDAIGRDTFFRMAGSNNIYSGEDLFTFFTDSRPVTWFDLRLFPDLTRTYMVQQAEVNLPGGETFALLRRGGGWITSGENAVVDNLRVESWLRSLFGAEAEDFAFHRPPFFEGGITLWLGDGTSRTIRLGPANADNSRAVMFDGSELVYILPEWTVNRLFRERDSFLR